MRKTGKQYYGLDEITVQVESFTSKAEWLDRVLETAPHLINFSSILNANANSTEAQLECIDNILDQLGDY